MLDWPEQIQRSPMRMSLMVSSLSPLIVMVWGGALPSSAAGVMSLTRQAPSLSVTAYAAADQEALTAIFSPGLAQPQRVASEFCWITIPSASTAGSLTSAWVEDARAARARDDTKYGIFIRAVYRGGARGCPAPRMAVRGEDAPAHFCWASSAAVASNHWMHLAAFFSSSAPSPVSYSREMTPLKPWRLSSASMPLALLSPVPQGWSMPFISRGAMSLKCREMMWPSRFLRHSTALRPLRGQWPVSAQAPRARPRPIFLS